MPAAQPARSLVAATRADFSQPLASCDQPRIDLECRWPPSGSTRRARLGLALSLALHGAVLLAAGAALLSVEDASPGGGPVPVEVEIITADAFESIFAEAGASSAAETPPKDVAEHEMALPAEAPSLSDAERLPIPETAPVPDPVEVLAREMPLSLQPEPFDPVPAEAESVSDKAPEARAEQTREPIPQKVKVGELKVDEPRPPKTIAKPRQERTPPVKVSRRTARSTAPRQPSSGRAESGTGADMVSSLAAARGVQGQNGSAASGVVASYRSRIMAHLARYKRYPEAARPRQLQGRVLVTFALDASGRVTDVTLARSSGEGLLDAEALAMVRRASPFPPIPPETGQATAGFTAPIVYNIND